MYRQCPRQGTVFLNTAVAPYALNTVCKTWSCNVCVRKKLQEFKDKVEYGASIIGPCWFITLTLRTVGSVRRDAQYVAAIWARFWYLWRLRHPGEKTPPWLKVIEATKEGQPHLHLIVGSLGKLNVKEIHREWSDLWLKATDDSYVVWVTPVVGISGAGSYLAKYMAKTFKSRRVLEALGFKRRWSSSANWPKGKVQLVGTKEGLWKGDKEFYGGRLGADYMSKYVTEASAPLGRPLRMAGDESMVAIKERRKRGAMKGLMKRFIKEDSDDAESFSEDLR